MNLSEIQHLLKRRGIQLTKSLGQNFLHDANQLERIAKAAELDASDKVLEIGSGLGPLTELLIENAAEVLAVEMDARLVKVLEERFKVVRDSSLPAEATQEAAGGTPAFRLLHADALKLLKQEQRDWSDWKLVSNLPYSVASPILVELSQGARSPRLIVATLQLEVAQRLMAKEGGKDYGILTLLVQLAFEPVRSFKISRGCFFPQPNVDSACITLKRRATPLLEEALRAPFKRVVKRAFSQRRKMMLKLLKQDWKLDALEAAYKHIGLSPKVRAEAVSLEQFAELTKLLAVG